MSGRNPYDCWQVKPWWCQPWSILLTGVVILCLSWTLLHRVWVTVLIALPILVWWAYFLVLWPLSTQALLKQEYTSPAPDLKER